MVNKNFELERELQPGGGRSWVLDLVVLPLYFIPVVGASVFDKQGFNLLLNNYSSRNKRLYVLYSFGFTFVQV